MVIQSLRTAAGELAVSHKYADLRSLRWHYVEAGSGPLIVLLHGFPDFWYSWRNQIGPLANAGFRVVAADLRGYNLSDKPPGIEAYTTDIVAEDVAQLIDACGATRAAVVGHDWGAAVGWQLSMQRPERLSRLAILNVPHPARFLRAMRDPRQLARSWYVFFFQIPWLPEWMLTARNFRSLRTALPKDTTRKDAFTDKDLQHYLEAWSQPGAMHAPLNYYRAAVRYGRSVAKRTMKKTEAAVLVLWGDRDRYVRPQLAEPDPIWVPNCTVHHFPTASHWVHMDEPQRVNELLIDFMKQ